MVCVILAFTSLPQVVLDHMRYCGQSVSGVCLSVRLSVCLSVRPSVNIYGTFRHGKSLGAHMWSVDPLGDPLLGDQKLGHCDLFYGLYRTKFSFPMYPYGRRIVLVLEGYKQ